jgi:branched-chain amino acid transport system permease protein
VDVFGAKVALNRLLAFVAACVLALSLYLILRFTWLGTGWRSVAIDPVAASLVGVNVQNLSALAFAAGSALAAVSGMLVSTFISFTPSIGVSYTLKALIVVIMAGVGRMAGTLGASLLLGVVEAVGGYLIDSALTIAINFALFMGILLLRPKGLFVRG